ncbi:MAG TPA: hypothetical protein VF600_00200 [Abditibacteriaceae bacterium]|jgi:hypothetical protein
MQDWRDLMRQKRFTEAQPLVEAEYARGDDYGNFVINRAYFYETWASQLEIENPPQALRLYKEADREYSTFASWATSGGEGTARMLDVNRIRKKIEELKARL